MASFLQDFIDYFDLSALVGSGSISVQQTIGLIIIAYLGCIFTIMGVRCVFELIKIVTDWSNFR